MEQYAFRDIHKGKVFTIYIDYHGIHVTARLVIDGLEDDNCSGRSWPDQDAAVTDVREYARQKIDGLAA